MVFLAHFVEKSSAPLLVDFGRGECDDDESSDERMFFIRRPVVIGFQTCVRVDERFLNSVESDKPWTNTARGCVKDED